MSDRQRLSSSQPYPDPLELAPGYQRHASSTPDLRAAIHRLVDGSDWAGLTWTALIEALLAIGRTDIPLASPRATSTPSGSSPRPVTAPRTGVLYGVWASRSRQTGVNAERTPTGLRLDGTLRFASGAGLLDRALVPVWLAGGHHLLVDLDVANLPVDQTAWITSAMAVSRSHTVCVNTTLTDAGNEIGAPNFCLGRPGFFPGGVGVAACWAGGAARLVDLLLDRPATSWSTPRQLRLGQLRVQLTAAATVLRSTATLLDQLTAPTARWQAISTEARAAVSASVTVILEQSRRLAGAAGLAHDANLSRAHHDLDLYVLQQNSDADHGYLAGRYFS